MNRLRYHLRGNVLCADAAILLDGDDPQETLYQSILQSISINVEVMFEDGKKVFLAMIEDPDQWETDWQELGVGDPYAYIASMVTERE